MNKPVVAVLGEVEVDERGRMKLSRKALLPKE